MAYLIKKTNDQVSLDSLQDFVYKILAKKKKNNTKDKKEFSLLYIDTSKKRN